MNIQSINSATYMDNTNNIINLNITTDEIGTVDTTIIMDDLDNDPNIVQMKEWISENLDNILPYVPDISFLKLKKKDEIKEMFISESSANVSFLGYTWNGGSQSAILINGKADILIFNSESTGVIHDINNLPITLTTNEIKQVASAISLEYDTVFSKYQSKKVEIANATTVSEIESILWQTITFN